MFMTYSIPSIRFITLAILLGLSGLVLLSGCSDDPLAPYEPEISNNIDSFSLQATGVQGVTMSRTYVWAMTGVSANVNQATTVDKGSASLRIFDAESKEVYMEDLAVNGTLETTTGQPGNWTIRVTMDDYSGTINFSVEAP
jgi:hypothetical protein